MIAPAIASKYMEASIPFVAIDIPHPGATYFGANNSRAGFLPKARMRGMSAGISEVIRINEHCRTISIDGDGQFQTALERVRKHLWELRAKRVLVGAANDSSPLGGLRAFQEAGRASEARVELRTPNTRLIGSVAFFPEKYGDGFIRLALDILARKAVPPAVFTGHQVITPDNVDHHYPNDSLFYAGDVSVCRPTRYFSLREARSSDLGGRLGGPECNIRPCPRRRQQSKPSSKTLQSFTSG